MSPVIIRMLSLLSGYLLGSFLTAVPVVKRITGKDIFTLGSGNPGFANTLDEAGKKAGALTLTGDILKTVLALGLTFLFAKQAWPLLYMAWAGLGAVAGHDFPFWHRFKGGKGVAVNCTYLVLGIPLWGALCCISGGVVMLITGNFWVCAMLIDLLAVPFAFWKLGVEGGILCVLMFLISVSRNIPSLIKLKKGEEHLAFGRGKKN